jgi:hypothetical protein
MAKTTAVALSVALGFAVLGVGACSSSSSGGGKSGAPSCQGNTGQTGAGSPACSSCLQNNCGSQLSSVESACSAYVSCYEGCQCSDISCISGCAQKIDSTCQNAYGPLTSCLSQNCSTPCGTGPVDGGGGG